MNLVSEPVCANVSPIRAISWLKLFRVNFRHFLLITCMFTRFLVLIFPKLFHANSNAFFMFGLDTKPCEHLGFINSRQLKTEDTFAR